MARVPDCFIDLVNIKEESDPEVPDGSLSLRDALSHKTKVCERIESQKGVLTMEISRLKLELDERNDEVEYLFKEKRALSKKIQDMELQRDMYKCIVVLKQLQEENQRTAEVLLAALGEVRAIKRQRNS